MVDPAVTLVAKKLAGTAAKAALPHIKKSLLGPEEKRAAASA